jgi:hypothetical protein
MSIFRLVVELDPAVLPVKRKEDREREGERVE